MSTRYYDPELGRFINADIFAATGQGFAGNNMFSYCGNNPVSRLDNAGQIWEIAAAGAVAALITGVSNAISTAKSGGSFKECLAAGTMGAAAGAIGFAVAAVGGFTPLANVAGRAVSTIVGNLGTSLILNGKLTGQDYAILMLDVTFDTCLATVGYYYNPIQDLITQTAVNSAVDGTIDILETSLYQGTVLSNAPNGTNSYTTAGSSGGCRMMCRL